MSSNDNEFKLEKVSKISESNKQVSVTPFSIHRCQRCNFTTPYYSLYRNHLKQHRIRLNTKTYKCSDCGFVTMSRNAFISHRRDHTGTTPYQCSVCKKYFAQSSTLTRHQKMLHGEIRRYACLFCPFVAHYHHVLQAHMASKHAQALVSANRALPDGVNTQLQAYRESVNDSASTVTSNMNNNIWSEQILSNEIKDEPQSPPILERECDSPLNLSSSSIQQEHHSERDVTNLSPNTSIGTSLLSPLPATNQRNLFNSPTFPFIPNMAQMWYASQSIANMQRAATGLMPPTSSLLSSIAAANILHQSAATAANKYEDDDSANEDNSSENQNTNVPEEVQESSQNCTNQGSGNSFLAASTTIRKSGDCAENSKYAQSVTVTAGSSKLDTTLIQSTAVAVTADSVLSPKRKRYLSAESCSGKMDTIPQQSPSVGTSQSPNERFSDEAVLHSLITRGHLFKCDHCGIYFAEYAMYLLHNSQHSAGEAFKCNFCQRRCLDRFDFMSHFMQYHQ